jgi:hypothetical protein
MKVGLTIFPTDYSMQSPDLAIEAEERDFESIWLPAVATTTARPLLDTSAERFSWRRPPDKGESSWLEDDHNGCRVARSLV